MSTLRLQQRLMDDVLRNDQSGCWQWKGQISNSGHGRIMVKNEQGGNRYVSAEHASFEAFVKAVPADMLVIQTCENRLCINPEHLMLRKKG